MRFGRDKFACLLVPSGPGRQLKVIEDVNEGICRQPFSRLSYARGVTQVPRLVTILFIHTKSDMAQLTAGCCARLQNASPDDENIFNGPHTVQFLSIKRVNAGNPGGVDRFRIIMSDGINFLQAMLATQLNSMVNDQTIGKHTVAVIEKLTCNYVQEKRYATRLRHAVLHPLTRHFELLG